MTGTSAGPGARVWVAVSTDQWINAMRGSGILGRFQADGQHDFTRWFRKCFVIKITNSEGSHPHLGVN